MVSTEVWSVLFLCVWMVVIIWWFHQVWPLLLVPLPRPSSNRARVAQLPKPGTPELCPACRARGELLSVGECLHLLTRPAPRPWSEVKGRGGRSKEIDSRGRYCPNPRCAYFAIMDAAIHAIVADGHHGQDGSIQNWQCQACGGHASDRYGTFLYRLKKPEKVIAQTLTSVSQGQGIRATALSQGVNKDTVLAWWLRLGERAPVLWDEIAQGKVRVGAVQLDELHTLIKKRGHHLTELEAQVGEVGVQWVWTAMDPVHKLLLVAQVGPRTREMACLVVHALCQMLASGCVPAFSSDGLMHYFTALTAHWGSWQVQVQGKCVWQVAANLLYAQVVKQYRRRKLAHVVHRLLLGTQGAWEAALQAAGTRVSINTALVERLNLTLRQSLAALTRRTLCLAKTKRHLQLRLNAYLVYYNLVRKHMTLQTTPACSAELTDHAWSWEEVLTFRLRPEQLAAVAGG